MHDSISSQDVAIVNISTSYIQVFIAFSSQLDSMNYTIHGHNLGLVGKDIHKQEAREDVSQ